MNKYYSIRSDDGWWTGSHWGDYVCNGKLFTKYEKRHTKLPHGKNVRWCEIQFNERVVNELLEWMNV